MTIKQQGGVFGRHPEFSTVEAGSFELTPAAVVTDATTSRTLSAADNGKVIYFTSGSAITVTTATGLGVGFSCTLIQGGAGAITIAQGTSTTLSAYGGFLDTAGQYAAATIISPAADTFIATGQLA